MTHPFQMWQVTQELNSSDWDQVKVRCLKRIIQTRTEQDRDFRTYLLKTGYVLLDEKFNVWSNPFHFWGIGDGPGHNTMGKILMEIGLNC